MRTRIETTFRSSGVAMIFLATLSMIVEPAQTAAQVTSSQSVTADWSWLQQPNFTLQTDSGSQNSNGPGTLNYSPSVDGLNSVDTNLVLSVDLGQGNIKSKTTFDIDGSDAGSTGFVSLDLTSFNRVNITDTLSLDPGFLGSLRIKVKTTGAMIQNGNYTGDRANTFVGNMDTFGSFSTVATADGETKSLAQTLSGNSGGFEPDDINEFEIFNHEYLLVINEDLQFNTFDFAFAYEEEMTFSIQDTDIQGFLLDQENDFSHTIELFANVYDENGVLVEGAIVNSSAGITYPNFTAVPEPSAALVLPFLAACCFKRRRTE